MATEWQRLAFPNWLLRPSLFVDIDARFGQRILRAMPAPPDRARQLPWLRLHLFMRDCSRCRGGRTPRSRQWRGLSREARSSASLSSACVTSGVSRAAIVIERRSAEGKPERLNALAAELVRRNVDVILTSGE